MTILHRTFVLCNILSLMLLYRWFNDWVKGHCWLKPTSSFKFEGLYYFDMALPFGCSISCATFEMFATFLQWVVRTSSVMGELEHYLDDFLLGATAFYDREIARYEDD